MIEPASYAQDSRRATPASPALAALDQVIRTRFARRTDQLDHFLKEWIKLDESQKALLDTRGDASETLLHYELAQGDIGMALGITRMCQAFADTTGAGPIMAFLNHTDRNGNDIWHYLAENLRESEDDDRLEIARILIKLDIDFSRKNEQDESPLGQLLIPTVRWAAVNSLLQAKIVTIEDIESSFPSRLAANVEMMGEVVVGILNSDLAENEGKLIRHLLTFALSPRAERSNRTRVGRALFDYVGGKRLDSVMMRLVETDFADIFPDALRLLQSLAEDQTSEIAASDLQLAKSNQQIFLYRRIGRRNRVFQNLAIKAVLADRPAYVSSLLAMLRYEDLVLVRRNSRGGTDREVLVVDKNSPAPSNPALSLLLHQDARGNLALHAAVQTGHLDCVRKLLFGLSLIDTYTLLTRVPNRLNLSVADLISLKDAQPKLVEEVRGGRLTREEAQALLLQIKQADKRIIEFLTEVLGKAVDSLQRMGGPKAAKPSFDLSKVATIQMMAREGRLGPPTRA